MLIGNLIQRVQSQYSRGVESDDSRLSRRHIYNKLLTVRSTLLFNKLNKKQYVSNWNYQVLPCVELQLVEGNDCPCFVPIGCRMLRTKYKLPKPLNSINNHVLSSVTSIEGSIIFGETTWKAKNWRAHDKYTSTKPDFFVKDGYLYITVDKAIKIITVMGLFNDPVQVRDFPSKCDSTTATCKDSIMDLDFPIDDDLIDTMIELAVQELVEDFTRRVEDTHNDARDGVDSKQQQRRQRGQSNQQDQYQGE